MTDKLIALTHRMEMEKLLFHTLTLAIKMSSLMIRWPHFVRLILSGNPGSAHFLCEPAIDRTFESVRDETIKRTLLNSRGSVFNVRGSRKQPRIEEDEEKVGGSDSGEGSCLKTRIDHGWQSKPRPH